MKIQPVLLGLGMGWIFLYIVKENKNVESVYVIKRLPWSDIKHDIIIQNMSWYNVLCYNEVADK